MTRDVVHWFRRYYVVILRYTSDDELSEHTSLTVPSGYDKQASHATSIVVLDWWPAKGHTTVFISPTTGESQLMSVLDCTLRGRGRSGVGEAQSCKTLRSRGKLISTLISA